MTVVKVPTGRFRWFVRALVVMALLVGLYLSFFFVPYPLFPHHLTAAGFSVYCDGAVPDDLGPALEEARRRVAAMPLYEGAKLPRFFVCRSRRLFVLMTRLAGKRHAGQGLLISAAGNVFLSEHGIRAVARRNPSPPEHSRLEGSWGAAIAHEVAHFLMAKELGFSRVRHMPVWKSEGYADYSSNLALIAADPGYNLRSRIDRLLDDRSWPGPTAAVDRRHFRWQLLVEYLCGVRKMDFPGLMDAGVAESEAWTEMMSWRHRTEPPAR